jgi:heavy metal translocating P-type ATPase
VLHFLPKYAALAPRVWLIGLVIFGAPVVLQTAWGILHGRFAADIVALLAIVASVALLQPLPGLVVVLMQTGGEALERYAEGRASRAVRELEDAAPRSAHRLRGAEIEDIGAEAIRPGDVLLVRPGELVPSDGVVIEGRSHVDTSRLTGEAIPLRATAGSSLMSGSVNGEGLLTMRATAAARESQYARIVELVRTAQATKAPIQRLADRYAVWFTPITLAACALAFVFTREAERVLAILVIATPCPLILATPVAIIGGVSSAARRQIIVRTGTALEQLGRVRVAVFDKTGTLTIGRPLVREVFPAPSYDDRSALALAAAVELGSSHLLARTIVAAAEAKGLRITPANEVVEAAGRGVHGRVDGRHVAVGSRSFVEQLFPGSTTTLAPFDTSEEKLRAYVVADGTPVALIQYADQLRPQLTSLLKSLRELGIARMLLLSGDRQHNVQAVGAATGITEAYGDLLPEDKVKLVREIVQSGEPTLMVGDGTNDAPALSADTVGFALAALGGGFAAVSADVVILVDDVQRVASAIRISRRTLRIALQSIWVGLGLSGTGMVFAALGYIPPAIGALIQEGIDVAVILNALRASVTIERGGGGGRVRDREREGSGNGLEKRKRSR